MSYKILIVDDIPQNIQVLGAILRNNGYEIGYASNGKMALERIEASNFDLILLDIMMPEMNGYDLCEKIKKNKVYYDIPIIFITAKTDTESIVMGFKTGGVDFITKPFNEAELLARVHTHLSLKESKDELKRNRELLQESNQTKDKLFSIISHDLSNALHYIQMAIETMILEKENEDCVSIGKLEKMHQTVSRVIDLLTNLIQWAHSQIGQIQNNVELLNLSEVINNVVHLYHPNMEKKEIEFVINVQQDYSVMADKNLLMSVLRNLLGNAIKFTPRLGLITLSVFDNDKDVLITIEDTGVGIPENFLEKLFKPNSHISTKGTDKESGTGLGLLICKEFIEKMGGHVHVKSKQGHGSIFSFNIPKIEKN